MLRTLCLLLICIPAALFADPAAWRAEWPRTDFHRTSVDDWSEILSGGPPRDGIPAITDPRFHAVAEERALAAVEPVLTLRIEGAPARAYPVRYLIWHEIVNDIVAGVPVAVTYCPLCNSGRVFDRRAAGRTLSFGVTGKLRASDMVMYDHETESWWQQSLGQGIVGRMTDVQLHSLPAWMESWAQFRAANPDGLVMMEPNSARPYGRNPYVGYDGAKWPFLYDGTPPPHGIAPLSRVVRVGNRAWPLSRLRKARRIDEDGLHLSWTPGMVSPLDTRKVADGRDVGAVRVRDAQARDVDHDVLFAFAFHALWPKGEWMLGH